jgi:predicted dehydrogenase
MGHPKPVSVSGVTQNRLSRLPGAFSDWAGKIQPEVWDVEEFASAFVRFENGGTLILEVSWMLNHKTTGEDMQMWLYGDGGGCHWPSNELLRTDNTTQQHFNIQLNRSDGGEAHAKECIAFADAVVNGKPSPVPAEESLMVMTILDALYRSAKEGHEISLV